MPDEEFDALADYKGPDRRSPDSRPAGHFDVARVSDLIALESRLDERNRLMESDLMEAVTANTKAVGALTRELTAFRAEQNTTWVSHHGEHAAQSADWEKRFSGVAVDMAYRRGLIAFPRLILEWLRLYFAPIGGILGLLIILVGILTGNVDISVNPSPSP